MLLTSAVQGSGSRRLVQPSSTQSPKHTETNRNTLCSYTCVLVIKLTYWHKDTFVQKLLHTPLVFQSVNTAYYVAAILGSKKKEEKKRNSKQELQLWTDVTFSFQPTPKPLLPGTSALKWDAGVIVHLQACARGSCAEPVIARGWMGGGIQWPASGDGNQIMNKFYILTHLIFSAAQGEFLSASRQLISLFHVNATERDDAGAPEHAQIHTQRRTFLFTHK